MFSEKKLYKDSQNKTICGVCAGLSEYLNLDVSIVRILWTILCLAYGSGIVLYFVCAIILPDKKDLDIF